MDRRELLKMIAVLTGGAVVGSEMLLSGCTNTDKPAAGFTDNNITFLDEVAETIIPKSSTPGAKDAKVGEFMKLMVNDCYDERDQKIFLDGIGQLDEACNKMHGHGFMKADENHRKEVLTALDKEAKDHMHIKKQEDPAHYFTMMKQLTLLGFFTSQPGATQVLRYIAVPGKYEGCIPYNKGERAWATS